ncbi:MAG: glycosyltransferase family 2 protein [Bacteroidota bacterium]|nr:glycosyltransferase family 2 protein [Bacteroidota bacterium]
MNRDSVLTVVIPCYNEEESLPLVLPVLLKYSNERNWKVIITNDGSTDATEKILNRYLAEKNFRFITHKINMGYGGALKTAIKNVDTEYLVSIDADGQHFLEDIDVLLKKLREENADMVVGSRREIKSTDAYRSSGKWIIRKISKMLVKTNIYDINSGMKICRTELAKKYLNLLPDSMAFSDIMTLIFSAQQNLVIEEPIRIKKRIAGKSTIGLNTAFDTVMEVLNIVMLFNPIKIFLPVSIIFCLLGIGWGLPIVFAGRGVSVGAAMLIIMGVMTFLLGLIAEQLSMLRKKAND